MKRAIITVLALVILLLTVAGCGKTYEKPWDQFCFQLREGELDVNKEIALSAEDTEYILSIMNSGKWINDLSNCGCDFVFYTSKQEVRYHSECGTFNDYTNKRSMTVTEEQRQKINSILQLTNSGLSR